MRRKFAAFAFAVIGSLASTQVHALACTVDPFSDVLAGNPNCSSVEWLKNRAVTLGCGGSLYCPADFVTRIQMALFMQRLADAVVQQPVFANLAPGALSLTAQSTANPLCTAIVALVGWPRTLVVNGQGSFRMVSAQGEVGLQILYTLDGNTNNWLVATPNAQVASADSTSWGSVSNSAVIQVPAGAPVKLGVGVLTASGSANVADSRCTLTGQIQSRTGSGTPFDE